jgi:hypothetical protein
MGQGNTLIRLEKRDGTHARIVGERMYVYTVEF